MYKSVLSLVLASFLYFPLTCYGQQDSFEFTFGTYVQSTDLLLDKNIESQQMKWINVNTEKDNLGKRAK
jgi:hypothetical protein